MSTKESNPRVGAMIHGMTAPRHIPELAHMIEELGFGELWLSEDYYFLAGFAACGMALQATKDIPVGLGIVASVVRHPAITAMEIATLANAYPGRFFPGIGHGVPFLMKQMGVFPKSILSVLRETMDKVHRLLEGETVTDPDSHFIFDGVALHHPAPGVPLYTGVSGPKSIELSGEIADGTVLSVASSPTFVKHARELAARGAAKAPDRGQHIFPTLALFTIDKDRQVARGTARAVLAHLLSLIGPTAQTEPQGINDDLADMMARGGMETIAAEMPEEWIDELTVAGEPDECAERIRALLDAGASSVILAPMPPDQAKPQLELTAEILPQI